MEDNIIRHINFTDHGKKRIQQRGIQKNVYTTLLQFADREIPVRKGCVALSITKKRLQSLISQGVIRANVGERLSNLVVLAAVEGNQMQLVTAAHMHLDKRGRHYRKNVKFKAGAKLKAAI